MGERLAVMTESWRPQRRSALDPQIVRMAVIAGGVALVGAMSVGGWMLLDRRPRVIPVIEADSRPVRVRPDNPGGMQVAGADEQIMGGGPAGQADAMAPPPEAPQIGALRAQIQAARQPAPPVVAQPVALTPPAPTPLASAAMPEPRPGLRPEPTVLARQAPHAVAPTTGGTEVQLAAVASEQAALAEWQRLSKRMPELLGVHHPAVQKAERDGKVIWRLRTGGFTDVAGATTFCTQVRAKGAGCSIATF